MADKNTLETLLEKGEVNVSFENKEYLVRIKIPEGINLSDRRSYFDKQFELSVSQTCSTECSLNASFTPLTYSPTIFSDYVGPRIDSISLNHNLDNDAQTLLMNATLSVIRRLTEGFVSPTKQYMFSGRIQLPDYLQNSFFYDRFGKVEKETNLRTEKISYYLHPKELQNVSGLNLPVISPSFYHIVLSVRTNE